MCGKSVLAAFCAVLLPESWSGHGTEGGTRDIAVWLDEET